MSYLNPTYPDAPRPNTFEDGLQFQDFVLELLLREKGLPLSLYSSREYQRRGESKQGIEVKLDGRMLDTPNVSIEVGEKKYRSQAEYIPSGILRNDNTWLYLQGNYRLVLAFAKKDLIAAHNSGKYTIRDLPTIRKFHLPLEEARAMALFQLVPPNGGTP